jgi:hypothetical protein
MRWEHLTRYRLSSDHPNTSDDIPKPDIRQTRA